MTADLEFIDSLPVAAFATDGLGRVVRHNSAAAAIWGRSPAPGEARWSGAARLFDARRPAARPGGEPGGAHPRRRPGRRRGSGRFSPSGPTAAGRPSCPALPCSRDADGRVTGVVELMLEAPADPGDLAAARLAAIVSSSDDAIVGKSLEGRVTSWNDAAARIFGWSAEEMIGQPITRIIPSELAVRGGRHPRPAAARRAGGAFRHRARRARTAGASRCR